LYLRDTLLKLLGIKVCRSLNLWWRGFQSSFFKGWEVNCYVFFLKK